MTGDVAALVLEDNRLQALALSIAQVGGPAATASYLRLIGQLEERGQLDRRTDGLADDEALLRRAADGMGLTRPEIAVLLSSAKLAVQEAIEHSSLPDDPGLVDELLAGFPAAMRKRFRRDILAHRLRREIIATRITNRMINRIGMIHPFELVEEEGATLAQVAGAFVVAEQLFAMDALWQQLETDAMPEAARLMLLRRSASALRTHMADVLRAGSEPTRPMQLVADLAPGTRLLEKAVDELLAGEALARSARLRDELVAVGAPEGAAASVAHLGDCDGAVGLARLARDRRMPVLQLARGFVAVGEQVGLDWVQGMAMQMRPSDPWERLLVAGLARDLQHMRLDFLRREVGKGGDAAAAVARWTAKHADAVRQFHTMIARARASIPVTAAMLAQIAGQARNLLAR